MTQRFVMIILIVIIIFGGGFYAYKELMPTETTETQGPIYSTQKVVKGDISAGVETVGQLNPTRGGGIIVPEPMDPTAMSMQYMIDEVLVEEGDEVKQGQVVLKLISVDLETQIQETMEQLEAEQKQLSDMTGLPMESLDAINPSQGIKILAPIAGKVVNFEVTEGKRIEQGEIIARIVDDSKFHVRAKLTPSEYKKISVGQKVLLSFPYFDGFYEGVITKANPNPVPNTDESNEYGTTFIHWVDIEGENPGLVQPGMNVHVGLPDKNDSSKPKLNFVNVAKVESFVKEEKIINQLNDDVIITEIHVHEMQKVEKGDEIITMSGPDVRDMIQEKLDKIRDLNNKLRRLDQHRELLEVKSPMDGIVSDIRSQQGETLRPGQWIGNIFNTSEMMMWTEVDDIDVLLVKQGSPVKVTVDALPGETFEGKVTRVSTRGEDVNGIPRFTVYIDVKGGPQLRPGMQARAFIDAGSAKNVLLVPLEAIFEEDGVSKVEVLNPDGTTKVVNVKLGLMNDRVAEVKSGLNEGDLVITGSTADLLPSQHIKSDDTLIPVNQNNNNNNDENSDSN